MSRHIHTALQTSDENESALSLERMGKTTLVLWLLLLGAFVPWGCCQHWSFGLSPGGKREVDRLSDTLDIVEGFTETDTRMEPPCTVLESPHSKQYRMRGALGSVADRETGHKTYNK